MLKRYIYGGIFALVCAALVLVIVLHRMNSFTPAELREAIPDDAILFVEGADYEYLTENFLKENRIWIDFIHTTGHGNIDTLIRQLDARIRANEDLRELLSKKGFSLSIHQQGKKQLKPLFYISYNEDYSKNDFEQLFFSFIGTESMVNDRRYEAETIYEISGSPALLPAKFSFACVDGIALISPSSILLEEAIRNIHDEGADLPAGLERVRATAGKFVHANVYVNYMRLPALFYPLMEQSSWGRVDALAQLAAWGELDLDIQKDAMVLSGMTWADGHGKSLLDLFSGQSPVKMEIHEQMPAGISHFLHLGVSDHSAFRSSLETFLETEIEDKGLLDDLLGIMDDELAWFEMDHGSSVAGLSMVEVRSESEASEVTRTWVEGYLEKNSFDMDSYRFIYRLDDETSFNIYKLPEELYTEIKPENLFKPFFTVYENCLVFGPSVEILSRFLYQNVLHKTFISDPVFNGMSDYLSNRSNLSLFLSPYTYLEHIASLLTEESRTKVKKLEIFLRRIPGLVVQYTREEDLYYQSISARYNSQIKEKAMTVWESLLDTIVLGKPVLVDNHNTRENEIFVQDATHQIYLINSTGRILWKQKLEGEILGSITQVDFYKNGKLQYLFNTEQKIHLIDRNGNYVERYPIVLRSGAVTPMAIFDYEHNHDYRFFVPGKDRKVYVYNIEGNIVQGWKFGKTESLLNSPPQHFRVGDKDYIVLKDATRSYILDRRGKERVKPKERVVFSPGNPMVLDMNIRQEKPRWISTDTSGILRCIYLDGSLGTIMDTGIRGRHYFRMQDMDKDGIPEVILAEGNELSVLHLDGSRMFGLRVRDHIGAMPDVYKFSASDIKIGVCDSPRNRIYLINSDGTLYDGFPLEGSTRFSIGYFAGSDSRFNLIVGSDNSFLYNYSIE